MKHLFVPYEIAVVLKEKGFNDPCLLGYDRINVLCTMTNQVFNWSNYNTAENYCSAPLYQQVTSWLKQKLILVLETSHFDWEIWVYNSENCLEVRSEHPTMDLAIIEALKLI